MALRKRPGSEMNFEASLQKLEAIVKRLEEEEIPLETSLKLFAEGQTLARACEEQLRSAENQIRQLLEKTPGKIEEADFDASPLEPADGDEDEGSDEAGKESSAQTNVSASGSADESNAKPEGRNPFDLPF